MTYFYDIKEGPFDNKGRLFKIVDKKGNFLYWEISQKIKLDEEPVFDSGFAVFDEAFWEFPFTDEEKERALTRKSCA